MASCIHISYSCVVLSRGFIPVYIPQTVIYHTEALSNRDLLYQNPANRDLPHQSAPKLWFATPKLSQTAIYCNKALQTVIYHNSPKILWFTVPKPCKPWFTVSKRFQTTSYHTKALTIRDLLYQATKPVIYHTGSLLNRFTVTKPPTLNLTHPKPWFTAPKLPQTVSYRTEAFSNRDLPNQSSPNPCFITQKLFLTAIYRIKAYQTVIYRNRAFQNHTKALNIPY